MFEGDWASSTSTCGYWYFHSTSRLFPKSNRANATILENKSAINRNITQIRGQFIGCNSAPAITAGVNQDNAVNPAWCETWMSDQANVIYGANYTFYDSASANKDMVDALQTGRNITPGTYLNKADINEPDFQQSVYGDLYDRLYDPWGLLYAIGAAGSEDWYTTNQIAYYPTTNGRPYPV